MRLSHARSISTSGIVTLHPPCLAPQLKSKLYFSLVGKGWEFQPAHPAPVPCSPGPCWGREAHVTVWVMVQVPMGGPGRPGASRAKPPHPLGAGASLMLQRGFSSASAMSAEHKGRGEVNPSVNTHVLNNWYFYFFPLVWWAWHASLFAQLSCLYVLLPK